MIEEKKKTNAWKKKRNKKRGFISFGRAVCCWADDDLMNATRLSSFVFCLKKCPAVGEQQPPPPPPPPVQKLVAAYKKRRRRKRRNGGRGETCWFF